MKKKFAFCWQRQYALKKYPLNRAQETKVISLWRAREWIKRHDDYFHDMAFYYQQQVELAYRAKPVCWHNTHNMWLLMS